MRESFHEIFNTNPKISSSIAFLLGLLLTGDLTAIEQNVLSSWLGLIAQTIATNASAQFLIENRINGNVINVNSREFKCLYNPVVYDINKSRDIINSLYNRANVNNITYELEILERAINNLQNQINELKNKD